MDFAAIPWCGAPRRIADIERSERARSAFAAFTAKKGTTAPRGDRQ
ncbi:MAG TPA: hypothetical protein VHG32_18755 [Thermoanaerobaculia bacterium]|jgi:hypothetical protein|nr:hypothetical protein [Thermoanaerobaculia bacterium]